MDPTTAFNWADYGIAGGFIAFLIALLWIMFKREEKKEAAHNAERERILGELKESQEARIDEIEKNNEKLYDAMQVLGQAADLIKSIGK